MTGFGNVKSAAKYLSKSNDKPWECIAITLDPDGMRYKSFLDNNKHLQIDTFQAINGSDLSKQEIINQGLATEDLMATNLWTAGGIGSAASHRAVRDKVAKGSKGYLVLEDDCYTHPRVADFILNNLDQLMAADLCLFGINTDSILQSISPTGLASVSIFEPIYPSQEWIRNALSKTSTKKVAMHRLIKAFGLCSYFISPNGARRLNERTFPLSLRTTDIPLITRHMPATGTDRAGCGIYSQLEAFVCHPFLAYTPNTDSSTRVDPG
jgi:GR25 family glycosyltransferase involved in LPS biosynthesis